MPTYRVPNVTDHREAAQSARRAATRAIGPKHVAFWEKVARAHADVANNPHKYVAREA